MIKAIFGIELPWVKRRIDFEMGFADEFFDSIVFDETKRALAVVGDPSRIIPWVDAGRSPHGGDPISSGDLCKILTYSQKAGLKRFLYHNHAHLAAAEWSVITELCGKPWKPSCREVYMPPG